MSQVTRATLALDKAGVSYSVHTYDYDPKADHVGVQAVASLGVAPSIVLKTIMAEVDGKAVCVLVPSDREVNMKRFAAAFGGKTAQMMKPDATERLTGYHVGGISPFGQKRPGPEAVEQTALSAEAVFVKQDNRGPEGGAGQVETRRQRVARCAPPRRTRRYERTATGRTCRASSLRSVTARTNMAVAASSVASQRRASRRRDGRFMARSTRKSATVAKLLATLGMNVPPRIFLLSPARLDGERARLLFRPATMFPLARALHSGEGATIGEVFSFLSGLYFRGKLAYAEAFARPLKKLKSGVFIITTNRGLLTPSTRVHLDDLARLAETEIGHSSEQFRIPLQRDAQWVASSLGRRGQPVLLGSIASAKYIDVLLSVFDEQLLFPQEFVGRGDMSRGGLLLRCVDSNLELVYTPVRGAVRRGVRPPKLPPRRDGSVA